MDYTTSRGVRLRIGRLPRRTIDDFIAGHPLPIAPTKEIEVFGGKETADDTDDPVYREQLFAYHLKLGYDQTGMLLPAIEILDEWWQKDGRFVELCDAGVINVSTHDKAIESYLVFVALGESDMRTVVEEIFYQSTVTDRGIEEAAQLYNVTWYDQDVRNWRVKSTPGKFSRMFDDRDAAQFAHYTWSEFCELPGPEQSAIVAHYQLRMRLEHLSSRLDK